eukprot:3086917-Rhodomonas_salina.1
MITGMTLRFFPKMPLSPGSDLVLHLVDFTGVDLACEDIVATPDAFTEMKWVSEQSSITFTLTETILPGTEVTIDVPATAVIYLPEDGITPETTSITLSTNEPLGPVLPTSILTLPGIARSSNVEWSILDYNPPLVKINTAISLTISYSSTLTAADLIRVFLPDFKGADSTFSTTSYVWKRTPECRDLRPRINVDTLCDKTRVPVVTSGSWSLATTTLELTVSSDIGAYTPFQAIVPASAGIQLPDAGILVNFAGLTVEVSAQSGAALPVSVDDSPGVGAFRDLGLSFAPPKAETITLITFDFVPLFDMFGGDIIVLTLPDFFGPARCLDVSTQFGVCTFPEGEAGFSVARVFQVVLTLKEFIKSASEVTVTIPSQLGISVPIEGLVRDQPSLTVSARSSAGFVDPTPILNNNPIGYFPFQSISFNPRVAGEPTTLTVVFVAGMDIKAGENLTLYLP